MCFPRCWPVVGVVCIFGNLVVVFLCVGILVHLLFSEAALCGV